MLAVLSLRQWMQRDIVHPPGVLVPERPVQRDIPAGRTITHGEFQLRARADFALSARVLSTRRYGWGRDADLSPVDLALGWGPMSDQAVLDRIDITQGNRWYFTRFELPAPLPERDIIRHSANMHLIPAEPSVEDALTALRRGDLVNLEGFLVDAADASGFTWRTSLTRDDTGDGSCELFLVTGITQTPRP